MKRLTFVGVLGVQGLLLPSAVSAELSSGQDSIRLENLRAAVTVGDIHVGIVEGQSAAAMVAAGQTARIYNLPRPPQSQIQWRQQLSPKSPVINPEYRPSNDVLYGAGPDPVSALTRIGVYAFAACSTRFTYNYIIRINPRDHTFLTIAINPIGLPLALYADDKDLVIIGNMKASQIVPLPLGSTASYPRSDLYES